MPTTLQASAAAVLILAAYAACAALDWPSRHAVEMVSTLIFPPLGGVILALAAPLARSAQGRSRAAWTAMTIGFVLWTSAEIIWAFYTLADTTSPFPSLADGAYLAYMPIMAGALLLFPSGRSWRHQTGVVLDGLILTGSFLVIAWLAVLRSVWNSDADNPLEFGVTLAYPAGAFLVLSVGFLVLLRVAAGLRVTLALILAALVCDALAETLWVYMTHTTSYTNGTLPDILTVGGALLIIVALVAANHATSDVPAANTPPGRFALWLPLVPLAVAAVVVAFADRDAVLEAPVVVIVAVLIVATLIRQVIEASEAVRRERHIRRLADQLTAELDSAARYVESILPRDLSDPVRVTSRYLPARAVGGDCFGYNWIDGDTLIVYVIDVSGHGVEPALLSVSVHNHLRSGALPSSTLGEPDQVLAELNDRFKMDNQDGHYFTVWYGVYQLSTGMLRYAVAGHPPALALTREEGRFVVTRLGGGSLPVGMFDETEFTEDSYLVAPGSRILLYSDGVLGEPAEDRELAAQWEEACTTSSASLDFLIATLPILAEKRAEDDCSLVELAFPA